MGLARDAILWAADNPTLRATLPRYGFVRRTVRRFMPGETLDAALDAARDLGLPTTFTRLGENVTAMVEADAVAEHYEDAFRRISERGLDTEISVKLTQLGLDVDEARCRAHITALAEETARQGVRLWLDMEQSPYVDRTIAIRRALAGYSHVGLCLQAYLHRTPDDLSSLIPLGGGVRLVKGAYREPPTVALPRKADVDAQYVALAEQMLAASSATGLRTVFGTHDRAILATLEDQARAAGTPRDRFEFHLLYGIQRAEQLQIGRAHV